MRKTLFAALALLATAGLRAEEPASSYSITSDFTYTTKYFFRGVKNQEQAFQPSVSFAQGPLSLGLWTSQALNKKFASWSEGSEIDFFGGYSWALNEKYSLAVGGTYYYYPSARPSLSEPDNSYEGSVALSGPVGPLTGKITWFHDFKFDSNTFQLDLGYSIPLPGEVGSFDLGGYYASNNIGDWDAGLPGSGSYDYKYYGLDASVTYKLTPKAALKVGLHWTDTSGDVPSPTGNTWFSIGVTTGL